MLAATCFGLHKLSSGIFSFYVHHHCCVISNYGGGWVRQNTIVLCRIHYADGDMFRLVWAFIRSQKFI